MNIPTAAIDQATEVRVVPMDVTLFGEHFVKRQDPRGRNYYWVAGDLGPRSGNEESDVTALHSGHVTLTPLQYDMTQRTVMREMASWRFRPLRD
jgi:5'-nucleotidase